MPIGGVAVVAKDTWAAIKGRAALKITWDDGAHGTYDSAAYRKELEEAVKKPGGSSPFRFIATGRELPSQSTTTCSGWMRASSVSRVARRFWNSLGHTLNPARSAFPSTNSTDNRRMSPHAGFITSTVNAGGGSSPAFRGF